jgi:hypothetical protein
MAVFSSTEEEEKLLEKFFGQVTVHPDLRPKFVGANTAFRAIYTDPDAALVVDTRTDPPVVKTGGQARAADIEVELLMSSDDGHKFWLGNLNIPMAVARRKVKINGPAPKLLKLLPAMQPAFAMYRDFLKSEGYADTAS